MVGSPCQGFRSFGDAGRRASCARCCVTGPQLARPRTLLRNRIHAVLADHGHDRPGATPVRLDRPGRRADHRG